MRNELPLQPPECLTTGEACAGCPFVTEETAQACGYLAIGKANVETAAQRDELLREQELSSHDSIVPSTLRMDAMERMARNDPDFQRQLREGKGALFFLDVRGLKYINDNFGQTVGDLLLRESGERLGTAITSRIRTRNEPVQLEKRRRAEEQPHDFVTRIGGDEFLAFMYNIEPEALEQRTWQIRQEVDVFTALRDDTNLLENPDSDARLPIIFSMASAHGSRLPQEKRNMLVENPQTAEEKQAYVDALQVLKAVADSEHTKGAKKEQYKQIQLMLAVEGIDIPLEIRGANGEMQDNTRAVSAAFFTKFQPGLVAYAAQRKAELAALGEQD